MDGANVIRAGIFLIVGLLLIFFPKKVLKFQIYVIDKLHIPYNERIERERKYHLHLGVVFIIISIILILFAILRG